MANKYKIKALKKARFREAKCCLTCTYADYQILDDCWGDCTHSDAKYDHGKGTEVHRLPNHMAAVCKRWEKGNLTWMKTIRELIASM